MMHGRLNYEGKQTAADGRVFLLYQLELPEIKKNMSSIIRNF